jgi:hypothetical protein
MKNLFTLRQFCSKKKAIFFLDRKILSFPAIKRKFSTKKVSAKFGVSYSVFDGEEILESSLKSIRKQVDYINVVYQLVSWHGLPADDLLLLKLEDLKKKGLIDEIIFFAPSLKKSPQFNENAKRNLGLKYAIKNGVNYFMTMDVDEFYFDEELAEVKKKIISENITHAYCSQVIYGYKPTQQLISKSDCHVQIFSKVDHHSVVACNEFAPCLVDPTRMILERSGSKHLIFNSIKMHHMSLIRKNIQNKFLNTSFRIIGKDPVASPSFSESDFIEVKNYFNIRI